ncbi:MAG TPA: adenine phosphoribosyltransferase [bacterium]|nr:adenine phosphoribosyltransferase [bacterium]HOL48941.1 adenine phosphoribosyltransferase [bacterium]HPO51224.1 adenine phosphoribosyltransferase [bacterium]HXK44862.1 adenine phosphoribosyltransferase [bacterium]
MKELYDAIRTIPDFPKRGVLFRDITPLIKNEDLFARSIELFAKQVPDGINKIVAIESRGFIFGGALACKLNKGFVPIRKLGKLPCKTIKHTYALEYGEDTIEIPADAFEKNETVVLIDDVLATGGTAGAACSLIERAGAKVEKILFLIELKDLNGREKIKGYDIYSMLTL